MLTSDLILDSLEYVNKHSEYVNINQKAVENYIKDFSYTTSSHWSQLYPLTYQKKHKQEDELDFLFLIGNQAFCFWGSPKWTIDYKNQKIDGWWALIASFERAIENKIDVLNGEYLSQLTVSKTNTLFAGAPEILLLKQRFEMLKKIGEVLVKKYNGRFHNFYKQSDHEAFSLLESISREFAGFDDVAEFKGRKVFFYKKAQLVLTDINIIFKGKGLGDIKNIDKLPGHADYKIPAILRTLGILEYNKELADLIDNRKELEAGSQMEVEVRANELWAINQIYQNLKTRFSEITPGGINYMLWNQSQVKNPNDKPYHLCRTVYY